MTIRGVMKIAATLAMFPALGGCVAAAIPALAAGGMLASDRKPDKEPTAAPAPPFAGDAAERSVAARATPVIEPATPTPPALREPIAATQPDPIPPVEAAVEEATLAAPATSVAAVTTATASATSAQSRLGANPYDAFYAYAVEQARLDPVDSPRTSAILATPGSLSPIMSDCAILPPAVLIDLDPIGGPIDLDSEATANADLAEALAALRAQSTEVFWISSASAADAGKLRERLLATGLDPWGRDGLLLMRRPDDRKQLRRRELSQTHCVVAIAGDKKGDFDELFDYLKNPDAAASLNPLVGEGWFITPLPFESEKD